MKFTTYNSDDADSLSSKLKGLVIDRVEFKYKWLKSYIIIHFTCGSYLSLKSMD